MLIPHFDRLRAIRAHYTGLEIAKYGEEWGLPELLEGGKNDVGRLNKLETGRRGMRDGFTPEAYIHKAVDCAWTTVVSADKDLTDPALACVEADLRGPFEGTPRQCINKLGISLHAIDDLVDPPAEPSYPHRDAPREELLSDYYTEAFRAITGLGNACDINLGEAIGYNMDMLEQRIAAEQQQLSAG